MFVASTHFLFFKVKFEKCGGGGEGGRTRPCQRCYVHHSSGPIAVTSCKGGTLTVASTVVDHPVYICRSVFGTVALRGDGRSTVFLRTILRSLVPGHGPSPLSHRGFRNQKFLGARSLCFSGSLIGSVPIMFISGGDQVS